MLSVAYEDVLMQHNLLYLVNPFSQLKDFHPNCIGLSESELSPPTTKDVIQLYLYYPLQNLPVIL